MKTLLVCLGLVIAMSGFAHAQSNVKIGYIDLQRVIRDSREGKDAKSLFETDFRNKKSKIDQKQSKLDKLKEQFFQKAAVLNDTKRKNMADDIEQKEKELKRMRADFREELQKKDFELTQKILSDLEEIIEKFGDKNGYTLIVEKTEGGVVYATDAADVTSEVIKVYDASKK